MVEGWKFQDMCHNPPAADREGGCAPSSPTRRSGGRTMSASSAALRTFPTNRLLMFLSPDLFTMLIWSPFSRPPVFDPLLSDLPAGELLGLPQVVGELKAVILKALKVVELAHAETRPWKMAISLYNSALHTFGSSCEMDNPKLLKHQILLTINIDNSLKINFGPIWG